MRVFIFALLASLALPGCTPEREAQIAATIAAVKKGYSTASHTVQVTLNEVCANSGTINAETQNVTTVIGQVSQGPRTTAAINSANNALNALNEICAAQNAPTAAKLIAAWNAYQSAKKAIADAKRAAGS